MSTFKKNQTSPDGGNIVFLSPFNIQNPSREQQTEFIMENVFASAALDECGEVYDYTKLPKAAELKEFIGRTVREKKPRWTVGTDLSATVLAGMRIPRRILINPTVTFDDLNNIPDHVRETTYGYFDLIHEADYERFCSVYPNAALILEQWLDIEQVAPMISAICNAKD